MSGEATGYVWRHSPYKGATLLLHLAIADVVNDVHGNEFWMAAENLAEKAKVGRSTTFDGLATMAEDGYLEVLEPGGGRNKPTRYRFLMPEPKTVQRSARKPVHTGQPLDGLPANTVQNLDKTVQSSRANERELKQDHNSTRAEPLPVGDALEDEFAVWWGHYPRKVTRKDARKVYEQVRRAGATAAELLTAVRAYAIERDGQEEQYTKHATTFLRNDRWRDYLHYDTGHPDDELSDADLLRRII